MTLDEIRSSTKTVLTPEDVCDVLGCKPYSINQQAKANAARLGFPVMIIGTRVKIPRLAFLNFMDGLLHRNYTVRKLRV